MPWQAVVTLSARWCRWYSTACWPQDIKVRASEVQADVPTATCLVIHHPPAWSRIVNKHCDVVEHCVTNEMCIFQPQHGRHWLCTDLCNSVFQTAAIVREIRHHFTKFRLLDVQLWVTVEHVKAIINHIWIATHIASHRVCETAEPTETIGGHQHTLVIHPKNVPYRANWNQLTIHGNYWRRS